MARRTKLTRDRMELIVGYIRDGNYANVAAQAAGITTTTFYRWLQEGDADADAGRRTLKREFRDAVRKADTDAERLAAGLLLRAGFDDWRAAATFLERRYPDRWRRRTETTLVPAFVQGDRDPAEAMFDELAEIRRARLAAPVIDVDEVAG